MTPPELIFVSIRGNDVSIKELQDDVKAIETRNPDSVLSFTHYTVKALLDKVIELDNALNLSIDSNVKTIDHLRCVLGSRNSFTPEARDHLYRFTNQENETVSYRTPEVEKMHREANDFLKCYETK